MLDIKREMKERARLARGLVNSLESDVEYVCIDVDSNDVICIGLSIQETKITLRQLMDNMIEMERLLNTIKRG